MNGVADLLIVGGGVNGVGIARDAAGRGLNVVLCEKADLASATSSASTKLIHGGLRYLEHYEFRLVREALIEREVLLRAAPHIIWPMRFVLPHHRGLRPAAVLRLGLFLYDHLGGRKLLPPTRTLKLRRDDAGVPLKSDYTLAFAYSDCWVDDARLVVLTAMDAAERGAEILTRTRCRSARRVDGVWEAALEGPDGIVRQCRARALVNAAGPWVGDVLADAAGGVQKASLRLVKGSHLLVRRLFAGEHAYIFHNGDGRVVFAIPYERDYTLIGTTDVAYDGYLDRVTATPDEVAYLCHAVGEYFERPVGPTDVVASYAGVRPLYDDDSTHASAVTRDYVFDLAAPAGQAPLLSIYGGKITTYRRLAEHALEQLRPLLGLSAGPWTGSAPLPGGDIPDADFDGFHAQAGTRYPWLPADMLHRLARAYGTRMERVLGTAASVQDLGRDFGHGLYEAELDYLASREWARSAEDVLWRRSKLGLHMPRPARARIADWFSAETATSAA